MQSILTRNGYTTTMVNKTTLTILSQNIRSISKNFDKLEHLVKNKPADVVLGQECWSVIGNYKLQDYSTQIFKERQISKGGGVIVWTANKVNANCQEDADLFSECHYESIAVRIGKLCIFNVYRPPKSDFRVALRCLRKQLEFCTDNKLEPVMMGDFNVNWSAESKQKKSLEELMQQYNMTQKVRHMTRPESNSTIDLAFVPNHLDSKAKTIDSLVSDHKAVHLKIKTPVSRTPNINTRKSTYTLTEKTLSKVKLGLLGVDWSGQFQSLNTDECAVMLESKIGSLIDKHCKSTSKDRKRLPYLTNELWKESNKVKKALRKHKKNGTDESKELYKQAKRDFAKNLANAKRAHNEKLLAEKNPRRLWDNIKLITKFTKEEQGIINLTGTSAQDVPRQLLKHFSTVAEKTIKKIPASSADPLETLKTHFPPRHNIFNFKKVTSTEVYKIFKSLAPKRSSGHDKISSKALKILAFQLVEPVTILINKIVEAKAFPLTWKCADVVPLYKKGKKDDVENYRPISLLPCCSKICEKVMCKQLYEYLDSTGILPPRQFGFRKGQGTTHAIAELLLELEPKDKQHTALMLLDFSKAFDVINHEILLKKLKHYGLTKAARALIKSYLTGRRSRVVANGRWSEWEEGPAYGCPQGSVCGPLFYLIYTSDMQYLYPSIMYADDTALVIDLPKLNQSEHLQKIWGKITGYCDANQLKLNAKKTELLSRSTQLNSVTLSGEMVHVKHKTSARYLGVEINADLKWDEHIAKILKKSRKGLFALARIRRFASTTTKLMVFEALVKSHILYAMPCWGPLMTTSQRKKIDTLLKIALRIVTNSPPNSHTSNMFNILDQLRVHEQVEKSLLQYLVKLQPDHPTSKYFCKIECNTRSQWRVIPKTKGELISAFTKVLNANSDIFSHTGVLRKYYFQQNSKVKALYEVPICESECFSCKRTPEMYK